tara:strand:- start:101 stop:343 length:243 start_codon:yes stop_codon:yes gene_type:complete
MKVIDIITDNIGPAPAKVCKSGKPDSELPASWLSSCRSKGLRRRDSDREHKLDGKRKTVGHKTVKGKKYGGPLPDYSENK